ncbi:MAG: peptide-methionine (S)-S-oxide reductase MsrA, partial [Pseudomonadota bacterium]
EYYFMKLGLFIFGLLGLFLLFNPVNLKSMEVSKTILQSKPENALVATFAGGCFWCIESEFRALEGVLYTKVGYEGGHVENPTYRDITTSKSGHAEAIEVYYDPEQITYRELVDFHLRKAHDPTQKDRQGVDVGPQYRSAIFYHDESQKTDAEAAIKSAENDKVWKNPIVTELSPKSKFWLAEDYHQQYYEKYEATNGRPHIRVLFKQKNK